MSTYRMAARGRDSGEILIYGDIGNIFGDGVSAVQFAKDLKALGPVKTLDVRINSYGGDVFDGLAMYRHLVENKARVTVHVDGIAASAASVVAMAGDVIRVAQAGALMIHDAWMRTAGNAVDLRRMADKLEASSAAMAEVYAGRTKKKADAVRELMRAETWMTAEEAVAMGFADAISPNLAMAAYGSPERFQFRNMPQHLAPRRKSAASQVTQMRAHLITQRPKPRP